MSTTTTTDGISDILNAGAESFSSASSSNSRNNSNSVAEHVYLSIEQQQEPQNAKKRRAVIGSEEYKEHLRDTLRCKLGNDFEAYLSAFSSAQSLKSKEANEEGDKLVMQLLEKGCSARELKYVFKLGHNRISRVKSKQPRKTPGGVNGHEVKPHEVEYLRQAVTKWDLEEDRACPHRPVRFYVRPSGVTWKTLFLKYLSQAKADGQREMHYKTWLKLMKLHCPDIHLEREKECICTICCGSSGFD